MFFPPRASSLDREDRMATGLSTVQADTLRISKAGFLPGEQRVG